MEKTLAYAATIAGIVVALIGACTPFAIAVLKSRAEAAGDEDAEDAAPPLMGLPVPVDHTDDAYDMLKGQLQARTIERDLLQQQLTDAHVGWRKTQARLDNANGRLVELGQRTF